MKFIILTIFLLRQGESMIEPVPVEKWNPTEVVGSEAMQWWNAKLPDVRRCSKLPSL